MYKQTGNFREDQLEILHSLVNDVWFGFVRFMCSSIQSHM